MHAGLGVALTQSPVLFDSGLNTHQGSGLVVVEGELGGRKGEGSRRNQNAQTSMQHRLLSEELCVDRDGCLPTKAVLAAHCLTEPSLMCSQALILRFFPHRLQVSAGPRGEWLLGPGLRAVLPPAAPLQLLRGQHAQRPQDSHGKANSRFAIMLQRPEVNKCQNLSLQS